MSVYSSVKLLVPNHSLHHQLTLFQLFSFAQGIVRDFNFIPQGNLVRCMYVVLWHGAFIFYTL